MSLPMEIRGVDIVVIPAYQPSGILLDLVKDVIAFGLWCDCSGRWQFI